MVNDNNNYTNSSNVFAPLIDFDSQLPQTLQRGRAGETEMKIGFQFSMNIHLYLFLLKHTV